MTLNLLHRKKKPLSIFEFSVEYKWYQMAYWLVCIDRICSQLWELALRSLDICREQIEVYVAGLGFNPYKYVPHENAVFSAAS